MSEERMGDQDFEIEDRHASREQERDHVDWNNIAARLERLRPLRDRFAAELAAEQVANAQKVSPLHALSAERLDVHIESMENVLVRDRVEKLHRRVERLELDFARVGGELADLRAAQSADPTGAHPYRSAPQTAAAAPSSPITASERAERVEGRPSAMRRIYGALGPRVWLLAPSAAIAIVGWVRGGWEVAVVLGAVALAISALAMTDAVLRERWSL